MMLAPVVSVVLGRVVLKERVSALQWMCVLVGALGMLTVLRLGAATWTTQALLPVMSACAYAAFQVTSRKVIVVVASLALLMWPVEWREVANQLGSMWWTKFGLMCLIATGGQLTLTATLQKSSLSVVAPFAYLQILFAAMIGFVFFDHWPDLTTIVGTTLIACAGVSSAFLNGLDRQPPLLVATK